jgi:two-component system nitrogen regulation response regulator GlnG
MILDKSPEESMKPVWIVDDDKSIRWVLEKTLAREKIAFQSFASATEALAQLDAGGEAPQVLVSDIRMPGQSGWNCCRYSRNASRRCR